MKATETTQAGGVESEKKETNVPTPDRVCPVCAAELFERKCKLLCPDPACGYYLSCSDFY
jgi:hypothetical protein